MGISTDGGMIVGAIGSSLDLPEDAYGWAYENGMEGYALYYDADYCHTVFGFIVDDVKIDEMNDEWVAKIKDIGKKFKDLTGVDAELIGCQSVS